MAGDGQWVVEGWLENIPIPDRFLKPWIALETRGSMNISSLTLQWKGGILSNRGSNSSQLALSGWVPHLSRLTGRFKHCVHQLLWGSSVPENHQIHSQRYTGDNQLWQTVESELKCNLVIIKTLEWILNLTCSSGISHVQKSQGLF